MKHRGGLFVGLLIGALAVVYTQPIVYPMFASKSEIRHNQPKTPPPKQTNLSYKTVNAQGFATYLNHSFAKFVTDYGRPSHSYSSGFSMDIHQFTLKNTTSYLEVSTEEDKVVGIKILGDLSKDTEPFKMDMDMKHLSEITMIYPNFTITNEQEEIEIELSEEDMNYRPLVAFDNNTFAILFFDQANSKLNAIMYVTKDLLLKLSPYMQSGDTIPNFVKESTGNWEEINLHKEETATRIFQFLRRKDHLPLYQDSQELNIYGHTLLNLFAEHTNDYLTTQRVQQLKKIQLNQSKEEFTFTDEELKNLTNSQNIHPNNGQLELPIYDPTFSILSWYSNSFNHAKFMDKKDAKIGVAFSKENMIVLLQEGQLSEKDSDDE